MLLGFLLTWSVFFFSVLCAHFLVLLALRAHTWSRWWVWRLVTTCECSVRARTQTWGCGLVKKNGHVRGGHDHVSWRDCRLMLGFSLCETLISIHSFPYTHFHTLISIVLCALSSWCFCALSRCARQWLLVSSASKSLGEFWSVWVCFKVFFVCLEVSPECFGVVRCVHVF